MITLNQIEKGKLTAAIERANREGLEVVQALGNSNIFQVISGAATYTVVFNKNFRGQIMADCNCATGKRGRHVCKHIAAAGKLYKENLLDKAATKTSDQPVVTSVVPESPTSTTDQSTSPALVSGVAPAIAPEANEQGCRKCNQPLTKTTMGARGLCQKCWNAEVAKNESDLWG
ncbi:MAG: SWIM zinc finger family protein [Chloroflexota bacterium]